MGQWVQQQDWNEVYKLSSVNSKAEKFEQMIIEKINLFFPEKTIKLNEEDKPWISCELTILDRQRKREYNKNKKSKKWENLDSMFLTKSNEEKPNYYVNMVEDLL